MVQGKNMSLRKKRTPPLVYIYCPSLGITPRPLRLGKRTKILKAPVQETSPDVPLSIPESSSVPRECDNDKTWVDPSDKEVPEATQEEPTEEENIKKEPVPQPIEMQPEAQEEEYGLEDEVSASSSPETTTNHEPLILEEEIKKPKQKKRRRKKQQSSVKELRETKVPPSHSVYEILGPVLMGMAQLLMGMVQLPKPAVAGGAWIATAVIGFLLISGTLSSGLPENVLPGTQITTMNPQVTQSSVGKCHQYLFCTNGEQLWDDFLTITRGPERKYCHFTLIKSKNTTNCTRNSIVTLTNDTCLLLKTTDIEHGTLILEYGKGHFGRFAHSLFIGLCNMENSKIPSSGLTQPLNMTTETSATNWAAIFTPIGVVGAIGMALLVYFAYKKLSKGNTSQGTHTGRVERSEYEINGRVPTKDIEMGDLEAKKEDGGVSAWSYLIRKCSGTRADL